jgi:hypothetical protein
MNAISIPLVDDNLTFLPIATHLLQEQSDVVVVGTAGGGEEFLAQGQGLQIVSKIPGCSRGNLYPTNRSVTVGASLALAHPSPGHRSTKAVASRCLPPDRLILGNQSFKATEKAAFDEFNQRQLVLATGAAGGIELYTEYSYYKYEE